jgi:hypothetical protein
MRRFYLTDPEGIRARLRTRYRNQRADWLRDKGNWPLKLPLGVPSEAAALASLHAVQAWVSAWQAWHGPGQLRWADRQWTRLGRQRLPERLLLRDAAEVAEWIGEGDAWARARCRYRRLVEAFPELTEVLPAHFEWLVTAADVEFDRLRRVLGWLVAHPDSGLYARQLPIAGLDSKWVGANQARLNQLLQVLTGRSGDLLTVAGLRREPIRLRLRLLDPDLRRLVGGLGDITAPVEEIAGLPVAPQVVFVVENLRTGLAFQDLPGTAVFMGQGYAVDVFGQISWLSERPCHYWGDLDTHGFAILDRLRAYRPEARSLLMDEQTLLAHEALWVTEQRSAEATDLVRLDPDERAVYDGLRSGRWGQRVRLEQERIAWDEAWGQIKRVAATADLGGHARK